MTEAPQTVSAPPAPPRKKGDVLWRPVIALILLALLWMLARRGRQRKLEGRRVEARQIRREAEVSGAQADRTRAEADERAARARAEEASAREHAARAEERQREAQERHIEADRVDPDVDEDDNDRDRVEGVTSYGQGEANGEVVDRHTERDDEGDVVRDEEYRRPRT